MTSAMKCRYFEAVIVSIDYRNDEYNLLDAKVERARLITISGLTK